MVLEAPPGKKISVILSAFVTIHQRKTSIFKSLLKRVSF